MFDIYTDGMIESSSKKPAPQPPTKPPPSKSNPSPAQKEAVVAARNKIMAELRMTPLADQSIRPKTSNPVPPTPGRASIPDASEELPQTQSIFDIRKQNAQGGSDPARTSSQPVFPDTSEKTSHARYIFNIRKQNAQGAPAPHHTSSQPSVEDASGKPPEIHPIFNTGKQKAQGVSAPVTSENNPPALTIFDLRRRNAQGGAPTTSSPKQTPFKSDHPKQKEPFVELPELPQLQPTTAFSLLLPAPSPPTTSLSPASPQITTHNPPPMTPDPVDPDSDLYDPPTPRPSVPADLLDPLDPDYDLYAPPTPPQFPTGPPSSPIFSPPSMQPTAFFTHSNLSTVSLVPDPPDSPLQRLTSPQSTTSPQSVVTAMRDTSPLLSPMSPSVW